MTAGPLDNSDGPLSLSVKADGKDVPDTMMIQSVYVSHEVNRIPEATLTIQSESPEMEEFTELDSDIFALGTEFEISAGYGGSAYDELFKGIVVSQRVRLDGQQGMRMELLCRDKALALTETRSSAWYEQKDDAAVMESIISDAKLEGKVDRVLTSATDQLRVGATDWDFLRLLADRNGMVIAIKGGLITITKADNAQSPSLAVSFGDTIIDLDISVDSSRTIKEASLDAWDEATQKPASSKNTYKPELGFGNTPYSKVAENLGDRQYTSRTAREIDQADLKELANARLKRSEMSVISGSVTFPGCGRIWPLEVLEVSNTGKRFGGKGLVTAVSHTIEAGLWTTKAQLGLSSDWTSDSFGLAAPGAEAITTPIHGLQIGKVIQLNDDPLAKQRILISLPMIREEETRVWARYAQPYASGESGLQFLPEVDDEVVVAFLNADPNAPIIVGSLHNAISRRSDTETAENNIKTIVTREKLKVIFDDEKQIITVETPAGHKLVMDDDSDTFSMEDMNGNSIVMDASGIAMTSDKDITLTASGDVVAKATMDAKVSGQNVTCEGQIGFTGSGGGTAEVSSGGQTTIEGSVVMIN